MERRYGRVFRHGRRQWPRLAGIVVLTVAVTGVTSLQPWPLKILVDHGFEGHPLPESVSGLVGRPDTGTFIVVCGALSLLVVTTAGLINAALG